MGDLLDELARATAGPMGRSRALKLLAGAFVTAVVPGAVRSSLASGRAPSRGAVLLASKTCPPGKHLCANTCCDYGEFCADPATGACCPTGGSICKASGSSAQTCCNPGEQCNPHGGCCPAGMAVCGTTCCPPGQVCKHGSCAHCPRKTHACGNTQCCKPGQKCCGQTCCDPGQGCCGDRCCDPGQKCCNGAICCNKGEQCCGDDCCGKHKACAVDPIGRQVCCIPIRTVHTAAGGVLCCAPGYIAAQDTGDRCCPAAQPLCGQCDPACAANEYCDSGHCYPLCNNPPCSTAEVCSDTGCVPR